MKLLKVEDRRIYLQTQIERSKDKFNYCKVSAADVLRYMDILRCYFHGAGIGPIACMGTRNGREVDLFRIALTAPGFWLRLVNALESRSSYLHSLVPCVEGFGIRRDYRNIKDNSVVGVEVNPAGRRKDIFIGSFDELPEEWAGRFGLVFSNSFDHSMDPQRTASEWIRIVRPGGILAVLWTEAEPTDTDPLGDLSEDYLLELFRLRKLNTPFLKSVCGYRELFLKKE